MTLISQGIARIGISHRIIHFIDGRPTLSYITGFASQHVVTESKMACIHRAAATGDLRKSRD